MKAKYTRIYADADGESHFEDVEVELQKVNYAPPAPALYLSELFPATQYAFLHQPAGWFGDWHPSPRKQYICLLAGEQEVETSDGEKRIVGQGDVVFLDDTTGKGHVSRVIGSTDSMAVTIHLPEE